MDGVHDLGGKEGHGAIEPDHGPAFHEDWEAKVFAMLGAGWRSGALKNTDQFRHAIERVDPRAYLTHGYYGRWLGGLETLFVEAGVLTSEEISARVAATNPAATDALVAARPGDAATIDYAPTDRTSIRPIGAPPAFGVGQSVRTSRHGVPGHTRLPAYARGALGVVTACHDGWVYPDSNAHGHGEDPQHLYTVQFAATELWGESAEAGAHVYIDLFEPYLLAA